jgi:hypothetical protein
MFLVPPRVPYGRGDEIRNDLYVVNEANGQKNCRKKTPEDKMAAVMFFFEYSTVGAVGASFCFTIFQASCSYNMQKRMFLQFSEYGLRFLAQRVLPN